MIFREATRNDIEQMHRVRMAVKENVLSNPDLVTYTHYQDYIEVRGKGWVCENDSGILGFAIADLEEENVWALFVLPNHEGKGIGRELQKLMLNWYFIQGKQDIWLSTDPHSRAAIFYKSSGWMNAGSYGEGEIKFTLKRENYLP